MKELDCENMRCPSNEISAQVSDDRICKAGLVIWSQCLRWKPYVPPPKLTKDEKKEE